MLHKRVKQDDTLVLEKSVKVRVRMTGTLASINNEQLGQWKVDPTCQSLNHRTKFTFWERFDFVEDWLDKCRVDGDDDELERDPL